MERVRGNRETLPETPRPHHDRFNGPPRNGERSGDRIGSGNRTVTQVQTGSTNTAGANANSGQNGNHRGNGAQSQRDNRNGREQDRNGGQNNHRSKHHDRRRDDRGSSEGREVKLQGRPPIESKHEVRREIKEVVFDFESNRLGTEELFKCAEDAAKAKPATAVAA
jgi:hypothetical protein